MVMSEKVLAHRYVLMCVGTRSCDGYKLLSNDQKKTERESKSSQHQESAPLKGMETLDGLLFQLLCPFEIFEI